MRKKDTDLAWEDVAGISLARNELTIRRRTGRRRTYTTCQGNETPNIDALAEIIRRRLPT